MSRRAAAPDYTEIRRCVETGNRMLRQASNIADMGRHRPDRDRQAARSFRKAADLLDPQEARKATPVLDGAGQ